MTTTEWSGATALRELGFSAIEAEVYVALLRDSPATGYRVSHAIGKPTANTYKAIESLRRSGAVLVDDGESRLCRAVPPRELLRTLDRKFRDRKERAARELSKLRPRGGDSRVYQLLSVDAILEKAREMLSQASATALLDVMPPAFEALRDDLSRAAARGVDVWAKVYRETDRTKGVTTVMSDRAEQALAFWPGCQLTLVVDAESHLLALLGHDLTVAHQGIWSESVFLSCAQHNGVAAELVAAWSAVHGKPMSSRRRARLTLGRADLPGSRRLKEWCEANQLETVG